MYESHGFTTGVKAIEDIIGTTGKTGRWVVY
jgi:hypothetical protein